MSYYHVSTQRKRRSATGLLGWMIVLGVFAALASGWSATRPVEITVDGEKHRVVTGTTIADLSAKGLLSQVPGNLVAVDGSVVATAAGGPALARRNGALVDRSRRVQDGDVIEGVAGSDVRESLVVTETVIPSVSRFEGEGPIVELKQLGVPGLKRLTVGEHSGLEVTSTVIAEAADTVFVRTRPKPGAKVVALTFDDGPAKAQTERILNVLRSHEVSATFFVIGSQANKHPQIVRRAQKEGHLIANHTYGHAKLSGLTAQQVRREIVEGDKAVKRITGASPKWFRPPYGALDDTAWAEVRALGKHVVLWDVDPQDWKRPGTGNIVDNVVKNVKPGSIVLLHDGGTNRAQTIAALPLIIERLKEQGYTFVTLDDLTAR